MRIHHELRKKLKASAKKAIFRILAVRQIHIIPESRNKPSCSAQDVKSTVLLYRQFKTLLCLLVHRFKVIQPRTVEDNQVDTVTVTRNAADTEVKRGEERE